MKIERKVDVSSLLIMLLLVGMLLLTSCRVINTNTGPISVCTNGKKPIPIEKDFKFSGTLLIYDTSQSSILAYDGIKHEFTTLMNLSGFTNYNVSLLSRDGKWLLVSQPKLNDPTSLEIYLLSNSKQVERKDLSLPESDDNTLRYYDWINQESFLGYITKNKVRIYGLFEPFAPRWKPLEFGSVAFYTYAENGVSGIAISPDLSRVLFVNSTSDLLLYNLQENKALWQNTEYDGLNPMMQSVLLLPAVWAEDASLLAVPTFRKNSTTDQYGILVLDKSGNLLKSSFFENRPFGLNFSHNKKFIVFYENHLLPPTPALHADSIPVIRLFNTETDKLSDLCVLDTGTAPTHNLKGGRIFWSTDDAYVAYNYGDASPQGNIKNGIIIQKLDSEEIRIVPAGNHNLILLGWSSYQWLASE